MGFVCDLELVSLTSGNGSYVAGAGDQLRTDERLCGRAPSAERRAPSAQPQRAPVGASAISHAHLCAARQLRNELYRNIRIKRPLSIVDSLLSSDSLTSSVKFSVCVRYEFSSFLLFMFTTVGVLFTCHSLDLPQLKVFEEHVLYTACAGLNNCLHSSCIDFDMC